MELRSILTVNLGVRSDKRAFITPVHYPPSYNMPHNALPARIPHFLQRQDNPHT
jgi:hypothetical protein